jgi:hypothetical protein
MRGSRRVVRDLAAVALISGLIAGTVGWQTDDTWPLAQMRMFPGGGESAIAITLIDAELANGTHKLMNPFAFHLKRAEIEGQMSRIREKPAMLGDLARAYNETVPSGRRIVALRLIRRESASGGKAQSERTLVTWRT